MMRTARRPSRNLPAYEYDRLEEGHIRLVCLLPGHAKSPISCSLQKRHLEDNEGQVYEALSWVWGPPASPQRGITVDGKRLTVRKTLYDALQALRLPDKERWTWIDAISINQKDTDEKSQQIPLMAQIYTGAGSVIIWMGKATADVAWVIDRICQNDTQSFRTSRFFAAVIDIFARPWFFRVWIIQEFALSPKDPVLLFGSLQQLSWSLFSVAQGTAQIHATESAGRDYWFLRDYRWYQDAKLTENMSHAARNHLRWIRTRQQEIGGNPWMADCLLWSRASQCTDAKDRVYGVLALLAESKRKAFLQRFPVDYAKSVGQVYTEATILLLWMEPMRILEVYQQFNINARAALGTPSWVSDFSNPRLCGRDYCSAIKDTPLSLAAARVQLPTDEKKLSLNIRLLDEVASVASCGKSIEEADAYHLPRAWRILRLELALKHCLQRKIAWRAAFELTRSSAQVAYHAWHLCKILGAIYQLAIGTTRGQYEADLLWKFLLGQHRQSINLSDASIHQNFIRFALIGSNFTKSTDDAGESLRLATDPILLELRRTCGGQNFFVGQSGRYGLVKGDVQPGDRLVLLLLGQRYAPFVVRPKECEYEMIGMAELPDKDYMNAIELADLNLTQVDFV